LSCLVNEIVEHELLLEVDTNKLGRCSLNDVLDSLSEASLDLDMNLHIDGSSSLLLHLKSPDQNLGLVGSCGDKVLETIIAFLTDDHRGWVDELEDLRDTCVRAGMGVKDLLKGRLLLIWIDVPNLELAVQSTDQEMILIDLVKEGRVLMIAELGTNGLATCLDIYVDDKDLLAVETGDSEDGRRSRNKCLGTKLDHGVAIAGLWSADKNWCHRGLLDLLFVLVLLIFIIINLGLRNLLFLFFVRAFSTGWLDDDFSLWLGLGLQVSQLFDIAIEVEERCNSIWLTQR